MAKLGRPVSTTPAKFTGVDIDMTLLEEVHRAVKERRITKRAFFEAALRLELHMETAADKQPSQLALGA